MKKNILIVGPTSEIAMNYIKCVTHKYNIFSISRKKLINKNIKNKYIFNFLSDFNEKIIKKKLLKIKFSKVIFFASDQLSGLKKINNLNNKKIYKTLTVNSIFPTKLTYFLIKNKNLEKKAAIIFFSSRSGSIAERGELKHHNTKGNHVYKASKALLNSFVKNLSFEYRKRKYIFVSYHPGWVATKSSKGKMPIEVAVKYFLKFSKFLKKKDSGKFFNFDRKQIPW